MLTIQVPPSLDRPCDRPDPDSVVTVGDLATFSIRQESALSVCDARRAALAELIRAQAAIVEPDPPAWQFWR